VKLEVSFLHTLSGAHIFSSTMETTSFS